MITDERYKQLMCKVGLPNSITLSIVLKQLVNEVEQKCIAKYSHVVDMSEQTGRKDDNQKDDWSLLPLSVVKQIVKVLTFGAIKYERDNWQHVEDARNRYFAACMRHLKQWQDGEIVDKESKLPHLAHACCCLIFIMWFDEKEGE